MEGKKTIKPDYKIMRMILNQCLRRNQNSLLFTVLIYILLSTMASTLPAMISNMILGNSVSFGLLLIAILLLFAGIIITQYLSYGKDVIVARMVEKKHITIGYLFNGFRDKTRRIIKASLLFMLIFMGIGIICLIVAIPFFASAFLKDNNIDMDVIQRILTVFNMAYTIVALLASFPFIFTWILLYRMPEASVLKCFGMSAGLVFSQFFRILGFLIYSSWKQLIALAILVPLEFFIQGTGISKIGMGASLFSIIISVSKIVAMFNAMMRVFLAVPIYLFSMTGVLQIHLSEYTPPSQPTTAEPTETEQNTPQAAAEPQKAPEESQTDNGETSSES